MSFKNYDMFTGTGNTANAFASDTYSRWLLKEFHPELQEPLSPTVGSQVSSTPVSGGSMFSPGNIQAAGQIGNLILGGIGMWLQHKQNQKLLGLQKKWRAEDIARETERWNKQFGFQQDQFGFQKEQYDYQKRLDARGWLFKEEDQNFQRGMAVISGLQALMNEKQDLAQAMTARSYNAAQPRPKARDTFRLGGR